MHTQGTDRHALWQQGAAMLPCHILWVVSISVSRPCTRFLHACAGQRWTGHMTAGCFQSCWPPS